MKEMGKKEEGFLWCQTPTSNVRLKVEGCRGKNGRYRIESEMLMSVLCEKSNGGRKKERRKIPEKVAYLKLPI